MTSRTGTMAPTNRRDRFESYEVYDQWGKSVGRVVLPRQTRFTGQTSGTVFLRRPPGPKPKSNPRAA